MKYLITLLLLCSPVMADSFQLDISADIDMAYIYSHESNYNWGNSYIAEIGQKYSGRYARIALRFSALNDSMQNHPDVSWDSAIVTLDVRGISDAYFGDDDSLGVDFFKMTTANWIEGIGDGADAGGITWEAAVDASNGDVGVDWGTDGGDMEAVGERGTDTLWLTADMIRNAHDSIDFYISGATISDTMGNGAGIMMRLTRAIDNNSDLAVKAVFNTNKETEESYRPHLRVYYSATPASGETKIRGTHLRKVKL